VPSVVPPPNAPSTNGTAPRVATHHRRAGELLRDWRHRRRLSQLDLALRAEVSARHLSFVETGRSRPSPELLLHLAEHLDVPLRERNALLLAAGYAPAYPERSLEDDAMAPVRDAVDKILTGHEPFPAVVVDQRWDLVAANRAASATMSAGVDPALLAPPANTLRLCLHPDGMAPRILNFAQYSGHLLTRLSRQALFTQDTGLHELLEEVRAYPGVTAPSPALEPDELVFVPLRLRGPDGAELSFFSTLATFGTALDVTLSELMIEAFFPADGATAAALRAVTSD
jgi:transcriptional regulator with XRE-family HTH domain